MKIKNLKFKISENIYRVTVAAILLLSILLRFINYANRWGLAYDQAHDALIARYALEAGKFPLLGPFSSAGPFQTGGEWYWIIMMGSVLQNWVLSPWVFMTFLYVGFVGLIILVAKELVNKEFALIVGVLVAVSPAQITQGTNLTNQSPMALMGLLSIWFAIRYLRTNKLLYLFLLSLSISTAASIHLQGAALGILLIVTLLISFSQKMVGRKIENSYRKRKIESSKSHFPFLFSITTFQFLKTIFIVFIGLLIPWIPVLLIDIQHGFFTIRNMVHYYLYDQYKISMEVLGRRWLTYAGVLIPKTWGFILAGNTIVGYLAIIGVVSIAIYSAVTKRLAKEWLVLLFTGAGIIFLVRYTRTPLFESYFVFFHAFVFLLTAWVLYQVYTKNKYVGIFLLAVIVIFAIKKDIREITSGTNMTAAQAVAWRKELLQTLPNNKFAVYDYQYKTQGSSLPLVLFLDETNSISDTGRKIGVVATSEAKLGSTFIHGDKRGLHTVDLNSYSHEELEKQGWVFVNPSAVYMSTQEWYKK